MGDQGNAQPGWTVTAEALRERVAEALKEAAYADPLDREMTEEELRDHPVTRTVALGGVVYIDGSVDAIAEIAAAAVQAYVEAVKAPNED
jgi:hypothetical protein